MLYPFQLPVERGSSAERHPSPSLLTSSGGKRSLSPAILRCRSGRGLGRDRPASLVWVRHPSAAGPSLNAFRPPEFARPSHSPAIRRHSESCGTVVSAQADFLQEILHGLGAARRLPMKHGAELQHASITPSAADPYLSASPQYTGRTTVEEDAASHLRPFPCSVVSLSEE